MFQTFIILLLLLSLQTKAAFESSVLQYNSSWSREHVNSDSRVRDSIGTALRLERLGPLQQFDVIPTLRSGPASVVLRQSLQNASRHCDFNQTHGCDISYGGGGNVGEVQYVFTDKENNQVGRSSQVMMACMCIGKECREAVLMQPISIVDDESNETLYDSCLYQREKKTEKLSECHTELLRLSARRRHSLREIKEDLSLAYLQYASEPWVYDVSDAGWLAYGQRGWTRWMNESEFVSKTTIDLREKAREIERADDVSGDEFFYFSYRDSSESAEMEYVRDANEEDGRMCAEIYEYARGGAAWIGTQGDEIATGRSFGTHFEQRPELVSDTELALASSAAALGTYTVWMMHFKYANNEGAVNVAWYLVPQVGLYVLESLPLLLAVIEEFSARDFQTQYAHFDGTLAVAGNMSTVEEKSAAGSVYVATALLGNVRYLHTRVWLVSVLFVVFAVSTFMGIGFTVWEWGRRRRMEVVAVADDGAGKVEIKAQADDDGESESGTWSLSSWSVFKW